MALNFDKYVEKTRVFLKEIAIELGTPEDMSRAARVLRAVLHTLRDQIPPEESMQLLSQLPLIVKGMYVDGWRLAGHKPRIRHLDAFIEAVRKDDGRSGMHDFPDADTSVKAILAVFRVMGRHVSPGEMKDVMSTLPDDLKPMLAV